MAILPQYLTTTSAGNGSSPRAGAGSFGGGEGLAAFSQGLDQFRQGGEQLYKAKIERDATAYVAEQSSALQLNSLKQIEAMKTDGQPIDTFQDRYNQWHDEQVKPLLDNAPNELAKRAMKEQALQIQTSMGQKAILFQADEKVVLQKQSAENSVNNIINSYSADPGNFNEYRKQLATIQDSSRRMFPPAEHEVFITKSNSEFAIAQVRTVLDTNPWEAEKVLKSQEVASHLTPVAFESLQTRIEAKKESIQNKAIAQQAKDVKDFQEDPAALAQRNGADMSDPQDVIDKSFLRQSDGSVIRVTPNNISVIPKQQASFLANQLNGINQPDQMVATLKDIENKYGDKYYPFAIRDLKNNGLSADAAFIAHMDPVGDKNVIDAAFAIDAAGAKKGEGIKVIQDMARTRAASQNDKFAEIDTQVAHNIQDTTAAMTNEGIPGNEINNIQTRVSNIANYFYAKNGDIGTAAKQATDWINAKYKLGEINGKQFRAPNIYDQNQIEKGLDNILRGLKPSDITTINSVGSSEFSMQNLRSRGYFTMNNDETGYILRDEFGIPVRSADQKTVFQVPIKDAVLKSQEKVQPNIDVLKATH